MTEPTATKVRLVMDEIARRRQRGEILPGQVVSTAQCERISQEIGAPVSESTFRRDQEDIFAKARLVLRALAAQSANPQS